MIRAILHLMNDQPLVVELADEPTPRDIAVICTNPRTVDGKKPVFIDFASSTFVFPMTAIRFIEVLHAGQEDERAAARTEQPVDLEDLEIDEDFLRKVREA